MKQPYLTKYINEKVVTMVPRAMLYATIAAADKVRKKAEKTSREHGGYRYAKYTMKDFIDYETANYNYNKNGCETINDELKILRCNLVAIDTYIKSLHELTRLCSEEEDSTQCKINLRERINTLLSQRNNLYENINELEIEEIKYKNSITHDDTIYRNEMELER